MDFHVDLMEFPSMVHSNIYTTARGITPLELSVGAVSDEGLQTSAKEFHAFMLDLLSDMYDHPEAYHLPVMVLESFCDGRKVNALKQEFPAKTKKILAHTRNCVSAYQSMLCLMGDYGEIGENRLSLTAEQLAQIDKRVNTSVSPIPMEKRLSALSRVGLVQSGGTFYNERYPGMFMAMGALAAKCSKLSGFDFFAFKTVDFRNLKKKHKPTPMDYFAPLAQAQKEQAILIHDFALEHKLRPSINTFWKVDYKYKGAQVLCISSEGDCERRLDFKIIGTYKRDDPALINNLLLNESLEFQKQAIRHIWRCDACASTHLGQFVMVLGKRQRVCGDGMIGFRYNTPSESELAYIKRMIEIRCSIIDEIKAGS